MAQAVARVRPLIKRDGPVKSLLPLAQADAQCGGILLCAQNGTAAAAYAAPGIKKLPAENQSNASPLEGTFFVQITPPAGAPNPSLTVTYTVQLQATNQSQSDSVSLGSLVLSLYQDGTFVGSSTTSFSTTSLPLGGSTGLESFSFNFPTATCTAGAVYTLTAQQYYTIDSAVPNSSIVTLPGISLTGSPAICPTSACYYFSDSAFFTNEQSTPAVIEIYGITPTLTNLGSDCGDLNFIQLLLQQVPFEPVILNPAQVIAICPDCFGSPPAPIILQIRARYPTLPCPLVSSVVNRATLSPAYPASDVGCPTGTILVTSISTETSFCIASPAPVGAEALAENLSCYTPISPFSSAKAAPAPAPAQAPSPTPTKAPKALPERKKPVAAAAKDVSSTRIARFGRK